MGGECTGRDCQEVHEGPYLEGSYHQCPLFSWHPIPRLLLSWVAASDPADLQMASTLSKQPEFFQFVICSTLPLPSRDMGAVSGCIPTLCWEAQAQLGFSLRHCNAPTWCHIVCGFSLGSTLWGVMPLVLGIPQTRLTYPLSEVANATD